MQQETVTLVVAGLGITGTLAGSVITQMITSSNEHRQWLRDCRKEEYRELLSTLTRTITAYLDPTTLPLQLVEEEKNALATIHDRIFIAAEIEKLSIKHHWVAATSAFDSKDNDLVSGVDLSRAFERIRESIVKVATKEK